MHARLLLKTIEHDPSPSRHKEIIHPFPMGGHRTPPCHSPMQGQTGVSCSMHLYELTLPAWLKWGFEEACKDLGFP